jgi:hypothetical protein
VVNPRLSDLLSDIHVFDTTQTTSLSAFKLSCRFGYPALFFCSCLN